MYAILEHQGRRKEQIINLILMSGLVEGKA